MADRIPSSVYIAKAMQLPSGKWQAVFSAPGLVPEVSSSPDGRVFEFNTEEEAERRAWQALLKVLNAPRRQARQSQGKPERYKKLTGPEFAVLLAQAGLTPTFFAYLYGTSQDRVLKWIDGVDDVPHPVRLLLTLFIDNSRNVDLAEKVTNDNTTSSRPERAT